MDGRDALSDRSARLAVVETKVEQLTESIDRLTEKVDTLYEALMKASGAKWAIVALISIVGFLSGISHKIIPFLAK